MTTTRGCVGERRGGVVACSDGRRRAEQRARRQVVGRIRALECLSEPLCGSDRRPTGGADEREEVVLSDEKGIYIAYMSLTPLMFARWMILGETPTPRPAARQQWNPTHAPESRKRSSSAAASLLSGKSG